MISTEKFGDALLVALEAADNTLTRCQGGFRDPSAHLYPEGRQDVITRVTANALVNASLAEFNDRDIPSALTLTKKGVEVAFEHAQRTLAKAAA